MVGLNEGGVDLEPKWVGVLKERMDKTSSRVGLALARNWWVHASQELERSLVGENPPE